MAPPTTAPASAGPDGTLVVIQASVDVAAAAHRLGRPAVFVQQPGGPVAELLDDQALLHSLDHAGAGFPDFVERVLRPLDPRAVVTLDETAGPAAELANDVLGIPRETADRVRARLLAEVRTPNGPAATAAPGAPTASPTSEETAS